MAKRKNGMPRSVSLYIDAREEERRREIFESMRVLDDELEKED